MHADICGPIKLVSHNKKGYFLTFTYAFSRKTWVFLLAGKSTAFECFKNFKALVEKESGCIIKYLRTGRGVEFISNEFDAFYSSNGIKRQLTTSYTPEQNG